MKPKKKILLIYPKLSIQSSSFLQAPFALLTVAPYLLKAGYNVEIFDVRLHPDYETALKKALTDDVLFVGVTSMTGSQITNAVEISQLVKKHSKVPVAWGGIHSSLLPQQVISEPFVDVVLVGEGENNLVEFAQALETGTSLQSVSGIYYKDGDTVQSTPAKPLFDLSNCLIPAWKLVNASRYNNIGLQTGRGCPYPCTYCYNIEFNQKRWRTKPLDLIFKEIDFLLDRYNLDSLFFYDDNFFTSKKRVEDICNFLLSKKRKIKWYTTCRADYFTKYGKEFFALVKASGCETLALGLESGSQRMLDLIEKRESISDYITMAHITHEVGIVPECGFMVGIPGETEEDRQATFKLMDELVKINPKAYITSLAIYTPYPGAPLLRTIEKDYGFKLPPKTADWGTFDFHSCNLAWLTKKERDRLVAISYVPRFVFWKHKLRERYITAPLLPFYYIMTTLAGLRWRKRFFEFPIEFTLLKTFLRLRQSAQKRRTSSIQSNEAWVN